jgi:hypothetical protein
MKFESEIEFFKFYLQLFGIICIGLSRFDQFDGIIIQGIEVIRCVSHNIALNVK